MKLKRSGLKERVERNEICQWQWRWSMRMQCENRRQVIERTKNGRRKRNGLPPPSSPCEAGFRVLHPAGIEGPCHHQQPQPNRCHIRPGYEGYCYSSR